MDKRRLELGRLVRIVGNALQNGAVRHSLMRSEWNVAGDCLAPKQFTLLARPSPQERVIATTIFDDVGMSLTGGARMRHTVTAAYRYSSKHIVVKRGGAFPLELEMWTRCRKCEKCLRSRSRMWRARVLAEVRQWPRTWFGTITIRPDDHFWFWMKARERLRGRAVEIDAMTPEEQFIVRHHEISKALTKMLKRVRKNTGAPIRYLIVCESHKSGLPHYHALVHECSTMLPVRHKQLAAEWPHGFTKWKLVHDHAEATYLCKYISKDARARVRASIRYGDGLMAIAKREISLTSPGQISSTEKPPNAGGQISVAMGGDRRTAP